MKMAMMYARVELLCEETVDGGVDGVVRFGMEERSLGGGMAESGGFKGMMLWLSYLGGWWWLY